MLGNELLSPTAARFFPAVTRRTPVATSLLFSIASPFPAVAFFPLVALFLLSVALLLSSIAASFSFSTALLLPTVAFFSLVVTFFPSAAGFLFPTIAPPPIFCCISSFCCRIPLSHRGIFFVRCSPPLARCVTPLPCHHSLLFCRHTLIVCCKRPFSHRSILPIRP